MYRRVPGGWDKYLIEDSPMDIELVENFMILIGW
jgi:hypothetical protein